MIKKKNAGTGNETSLDSRVQSGPHINTCDGRSREIESKESILDLEQNLDRI